jgi:uroporphyrinogen decarboxylase
MKPLEPQSVQPVCEAVSLLIAELGDVPLIGFAGAPFTLASYLVEGGPSRNHARTKAMMLAEPASWHALMAKLTDLTVAFLRAQIEAGVDAIQMFDSWAGTLSLANYRQHVLPYSSRVFATLAEYRVPMTHFGVGTAELLGSMSAALKCGMKAGQATVVGVDWRTSLVDAAARVEPGTALQGNLDPVVLLAGWPVAERAARGVVDDGRRAVDAGATGHVFNLGHGVLPETDPGVLTELVSLVHSL